MGRLEAQSLSAFQNVLRSAAGLKELDACRAMASELQAVKVMRQKRLILEELKRRVGGAVREVLLDQLSRPFTRGRPQREGQVFVVLDEEDPGGRVADPSSRSFRASVQEIAIATRRCSDACQTRVCARKTMFAFDGRRHRGTGGFCIEDMVSRVGVVCLDHQGRRTRSEISAVAELQVLYSRYCQDAS